MAKTRPPAPEVPTVDAEEVETSIPVVAARQAPLVARVYNADLGEWVDSTPDRKRQAAFLQQQLQAATLVQAVALKRMYDDGLYADLGYQTWKEYVELGLDMSTSYVRQLRTIADRFEGLLPEGWQSERPMLEAPAEVQHAAQLSALGSKKLYELVRVQDVDFSEALSDGIVRLPGGATMTLDELKAQTARELALQLREQKKAMSERIAVLEEEKRQAELERDHLKAVNEVAVEQYATGKALERRYGARAAQIEAKTATLNEARQRLNQFVELMQQADVQPDDPDGLRADLFNTIGQARDLVERLDVHYEAVIAREMENF